MKRRTPLIAILLLAACSQPAKMPPPEEPWSLDRTVTWLIDSINDASKIHYEMGDKVITHSSVATRQDRCVLSIRDKRHTQLGGAWEESDIRATLDLRQLAPRITSKEFRGSGYHGADLTLSALGDRATIPQDAHFNSSGVGPVHATDPAKTFDLTIADYGTAQQIAHQLTRAIDMCRAL